MTQREKRDYFCLLNRAPQAHGLILTNSLGSLCLISTLCKSKHGNAFVNPRARASTPGAKTMERGNEA